MPFFSDQIRESGAARQRQIIIKVLIGHPHDEDQPSPLALLTQENIYDALIDTGATRTCISPKIVSELAITSAGIRPIGTAAGNINVKVYHVSFHIPVTSRVGPDSNPQVDLHSEPNLAVTEIAQPQNFDVLLGMDILKNCTLSIARDTFTLGY